MMVDTMTIERAVRRKPRHSKEFKDEVVRACSEPGASVAGIALANGVNANLVLKWMAARGIASARQRGIVNATRPIARRTEFVPVTIAAEVPPAPNIRIEAQRANAVVKIEWPVAAAAECAAWLRDWLK